MTNCYHQFEIEEDARKLFACRTPWGIYRYKRMVMGTCIASSEIQKRIREMLKCCKNTIHIKDYILVYGIDSEHDTHIEKLLKILQDKGITLRQKKCHLGKPEVKWFGYIFSDQGYSPDPEKCRIIKEWPSPKTTAEVKSFLQTIQFNAKFLGGKQGASSYRDITAPLRELTKKHIHFVWGTHQETAFQELKDRLCSDQVLGPYANNRDTQLYVDSSHKGTQATVAQRYIVNGESMWRPVNHTSCSWTPAELRYSQIERESNGK